MRFRFRADCEFEAEDIDDAFRLLEGHFASLGGSGGRELDHIGTLEIEPIQ
jgi:hypothetical protein